MFHRRLAVHLIDRSSAWDRQRVGLIAGVLAKSFVPVEGPGGILGDIIVGILGALIGGCLQLSATPA